MTQLKAITVAYCANPSPKFENAWFNSVVVELTFELIKNPVKDTHWHFYFRVCFEYWKKLCVRYRTIYAIARAMLSTALNARVIEYDSVVRMEEELRIAAPYHAPNGVISSSARFDSIQSALAGIEEATVDNLARQLDELFMFRELTNLQEEQGDDCNG